MHKNRLILKHIVILIILALSIDLVSCQLSHLYKKVLNTIDPEAKCLDGSPGLLYTHEGTEKDKFVIFFEGGGACGATSISQVL
jgi:hypothetical protein